MNKGKDITKGLYLRPNECDFNTVIEAINLLKNITIDKIITVKKDIFTHEYTSLCIVSRKIYKSEKMIYIKCKDEKRINLAYQLQKKSNTKFDFFLEENITSLEYE